MLVRENSCPVPFSLGAVYGYPVTRSETLEISPPRLAPSLLVGKIRFARNDKPALWHRPRAKRSTFVPITDGTRETIVSVAIAAKTLAALALFAPVSLSPRCRWLKDAFAPHRAVSRVPRRATLNDEIFVDGTSWMRCRHTYTYTRAR